MSRAAPIRVGFDEAGLGPTLGPLVVAGFATRRRGDVDELDARDDLREPLAELIAEPGCRDGRLEVGDSKKIHAGARKLERVERTALATVAWVHGELPASVGELLRTVGVVDFEAEGDRRAPWWRAEALAEALPIHGEREQVLARAEALGALGERVGVEPAWYRADVISAARINRELAEEQALAEPGTKNTWATHAVLRLAARAVDDLEGETLAIWCDKAGGRQAYEQPLRRAFPDLEAGLARRSDPSLELFTRQAGARLIRVGETRERSRYRLELGPRRVELGFVMKGDHIDPRISWASILAKYLRELILRAFNRHFAARVSELRPTAGYPQDARRFIAEVEAADGAADLERSAWIRSK